MKSILPLLCWLAWGFTSLPASSAASGEILSIGSATKPVEVQKSRVAKQPRSIQGGLDRTPTDIRLPAPDLEAVQAEDAATDDHGKPLRIGLFRELTTKVSAAKAKSNLGKWTALADGGHVWRLGVESAEAIGIRVHLSGLDLPEGCEIVAYSTAKPSQMRGPYSSQNLGGREAFWTGTVFAENVTVEAYCPPEVAPETVSLSVDRMIHIYRDPVAKAKEGNCHNDVACYPAWVSTGNGVAGIGTVGEPGYMWCTGCLLNDQAPSTFIDYFMTANHCVAKQSEADDTEFYWFYQVGTCNGSPPNIASVPTTDGGADYLAGRTFNVANDFAFLRLRTASPGGVTYAGWTVSTPSMSETLTGIHHPDGAYKRISFSQLDSSDANYWYVQWSSGVTEPGSSGSPLFNANKQFIGQLYGGESACNLQSGIDEYGRFSASYPFISQWLGTPIVSLSISPSSRSHSSAAAAGQAIAVSASIGWTATDNASWITITSGGSGSGNGTVVYGVSANGGAARSGAIVVSGGGISRTCTIYQADGDIYEPDNSVSAAKGIGNTQLQNRSIHAAGNVDWVKFVVGGIGAKNLWLETAGTGDYDTQMWLFKGSTGAQLGYSDDISDTNRYSRIRVATLSPGTHYIKIQDYSNDGTIPAYTLRANWATQYGPDAYESDNSASAARLIARGQTQSRNIHAAGNVDWVKFVVGSAGARNVVVETGGASGDTQMWLYRGNGTPLRYDDNSGAGTFSRISVATLTPGTYFLKIQENGNNAVISAYTLKANWSTP